MTDTQTELFPRARRTDPSTSHAAAKRMAPSAGALETQILDLLGRYRSLTKDEIGISLAIDPRRWPSIASCLSRLKNAGKLEWDGTIRGNQHLWRLAVQDVNTQGRT